MAARSRAELMAEISKIDVQINDLAKQLPSVPVAPVPTFPWGFWIIALVLLTGALYADGQLLERVQLQAYRNIILIVGSCFALWALVQTARSIMGKSFGKTAQYRHINQKIDQLRRERAILSHQLK